MEPKNRGGRVWWHVLDVRRVNRLRCAIEMQNGMAERNAGLPPDTRIEFRVGIPPLGDVVAGIFILQPLWHSVVS